MDVTLEAAPLHETSFEEAYRVHVPRLCRSLLASTGDAAIAEDAVAEAFAQALRRGPAIRDPGRWVWRSAYRMAAGALADRRRDLEAPRETAYHLDEVPASLAEVLAALPERQRAAVVLHHARWCPGPAQGGSAPRRERRRRHDPDRGGGAPPRGEGLCFTFRYALDDGEVVVFLDDPRVLPSRDQPPEGWEPGRVAGWGPGATVQVERADGRRDELVGAGGLATTRHGPAGSRPRRSRRR